MGERYIETQSASSSSNTSTKILLEALTQSEFLPLLVPLILLALLSGVLGKKKGVLAHARFGGRLEKLNAVKEAQKQRVERDIAKTTLYAGEKPMEGWKPQVSTLLTGNAPSLPLPHLNQHLIALGSTGCGKTTTIVNRLIQDAIREGYPLIVFDPKGELAAINAPYAKAHDYEDYYLAPGQPYTDRFNILDWMRSSRDSTRAQQIAKTIQANAKPAGVSRQNDFFGDSGEILIRSALMLAKESDYPDLLMTKRILALPDLCQRIQDCDKSGKLNPWIENSFQQFMSGKAATKTIAGIASTAGLVFDNFTQEEFFNAFIGKSTIPMDFTGKKILFVQPPMDRADVVMPVLTAAVEILVEDNMSKERKDPLLLILEEFPLGNWRKTQQWMSYQRSNGLAVVLIAQLWAQIRERYGEDLAKTILANANTQFYFNCNDVETAKLVSDRCGQTEVAVKQTSKTTGKSGNSHSTSEQKQAISLKSVDELLKMSEGEFIMFSIAHGSRGQSSIPVHMTYRIPLWELNRDKQMKLAWAEYVRPERCKQAEVWHLDDDQRVTALLERRKAAEAFLPLLSEPKVPQYSQYSQFTETDNGILKEESKEFVAYV